MYQLCTNIFFPFSVFPPHACWNTHTPFTSCPGPNGVKIADVDGAAFDKVIAINLKGSFNVTKHSIPHMLANNYGRVLLIASIAGKEGNAVRLSISTHRTDHQSFIVTGRITTFFFWLSFPTFWLSFPIFYFSPTFSRA